MDMRVHYAEVDDFHPVRRFYDEVALYMRGTAFDCYWRPSEYPSDGMLSQAILGHELLVGLDERSILAACVVNRHFEPAYGDVPWPSGVPASQASVLHLLAVHPSCRHEGHGRALLETVTQLARMRGDKALRLDVHVSNKPAIQLYKNHGFVKVRTSPQFFETGLVYFDLMEQVL